MRAWHVAIGGRTDYSDIEYWDHLVQAGPAAALDIIDSVLADDRQEADARALAHGAASRSQYELGDLRSALASARAALDAAATSSAEVRSAVVMGASVVLAECGQVDEAIRRLEEVASAATEMELGRLRLQLAYVLQQAGRLNEALQGFDLCESLFAQGGTARDWVRLHLNRGLVLLQQGRIEAAESDLERAASTAADHGLSVMAATAVADLAVLRGRARRLAESVREFQRAAEMFAAVGNPERAVAHMEFDRAEVMMHSGLVTDAVEASRAALRLVEPSGNPVLVGDATLMVARTELAAGLHRSAQMSADRAATMFVDSGRSEMVHHARSLAVQAALVRARRLDELEPCLGDAAEAMEALHESGWSDLADQLAVARIRAARRWGAASEVRPDLDRLRRGTANGRRDIALVGWWAEAVAEVMSGHVEAASAACHEGLGILDGIVAEAPSLEARSAAMRMGNDLSELLIEIAIDQADAETVLAAAEGTRARSLHDELATAERHRPLTVVGAEGLRRELAARLGDRTIVEWVVARNRVHAVVFDSAGSRLVDVGDRSSIARACDRVTMWLDVASTEPDESSERARRATRQLDELLLGALDLPPDIGLVMIPVDLLHRIPWSGLPSFAGRPVAIAPTAQTWLEADRRAAGAAGSVGLVIGPELEASAVERAAIEATYPVAVVASGAGATTATLRSMLGGSDVVQIAAHGWFRSDHPLLSTLRFDDGDATLHDVIPERVRSKLVVLSSCEGGAQGTADGSEVLGMSAVLLARGAATVVAPLTAVRDLECAEFVVEVHRELAGGEPVACALANVRERWLADDDLGRWAVASSFSCFGSGAVRVVG